LEDMEKQKRDTETDPKKDTDRNTDEEIDKESTLRDCQTITERKNLIYRNRHINLEIYINNCDAFIIFLY